ncbi:MAG TPA: succinate dehydrogenase, cytochrome b556 subunit, partial [Lentzea sp.]|nr:succinate dehydrogenase, cytochrome b556 subunit [Lentzea sp.]
MTSAGAPERSGTTRGGGTLYRGDLGMWSWVAHRIT